MKEVRMPYAEHEEMKETIEKQNTVITALMKKDNVVVLRATEYHFGYCVPRIEYEGKDTVIKELSEKYADMEREFRELRDAFHKKRREKNQKKLQNCSWWSFLLLSYIM
jgi:hypothetical protein